MNIVYCEKCRGYTPEGFPLCPKCMRDSGAGESDIKTVAELMEIASIVNMGDTDASQRAAIESITKIKNRLEEADYGKKEKAEKTPLQADPNPESRPPGQSVTTTDSGD